MTLIILHDNVRGVQDATNQRGLRIADGAFDLAFKM